MILIWAKEEIKRSHEIPFCWPTSVDKHTDFGIPITVKQGALASCRKERKGRKMAAYVLTAIYMAVLAVFSLVSHYPEPVRSIFETFGDILLHAFAYSLLALLLCWVIKPVRPSQTVPPITLAFLYGLVLEAIQAFVPGRYFSVADLITNLAGASVGALAYTFLRR